MKSAIVAALASLAALSAPAMAVTVDQGVVLITQADALAGGVTPGDTAGFPITLSVSGSYRFASNLLVNTAVNGIEVTAPEVQLDLAGFRMAGSGVGVRAVEATSQRALTVKNGTIRGFTQVAVFAGNNATVDRMRIVDNPIPDNLAVVNTGDNLSVRNSNISRNGNAATLVCGSYCIVQYNIMVGTSTIGGAYLAGEGAIFLGNTISNFGAAVVSSNPISFGDNSFIGNALPSLATLLPLDPNQPPPPP